MRPLILFAALCLGSSGGCTAQPPMAMGTIPTQLPASVIVDDQVGISVELAYQAASLAERTLLKAKLVSPTGAAKLAALDNQAYEGVCYTRTAYDVVNGRSPEARLDGCPEVTKHNHYVTYADAARAAIAAIQGLVSGLKQGVE